MTFPAPPPTRLDQFQMCEDDTIPNPGAFEAHLDFSTPHVSFENGFPFGELSEHVGDYLPSLSTASGEVSGRRVSEEMFSAACASAAVKLIGPEDVGTLFSECAQQARFPEPVTRAIESQGEFLSPGGTHWWKPLSKMDLVAALVRSSGQLADHQSLASVAEKFWLPSQPNDPRTRAFIASGVERYVNRRGLKTSSHELIDKVFAGVEPPTFESSVQTSSVRLPELDVIFQEWNGKEWFFSVFNSPPGREVLELLGLHWPQPTLRDLYVGEEDFHVIQGSLEHWRSIQNSVFEDRGVALSSVNYTAAGSSLQLCAVSDDDVGTVISSPLPFSHGWVDHVSAFCVRPVYRGHPNAYFARRDIRRDRAPPVQFLHRYLVTT